MAKLNPLFLCLKREMVHLEGMQEKISKSTHTPYFLIPCSLGSFFSIRLMGKEYEVLEHHVTIFSDMKFVSDQKSIAPATTSECHYTVVLRHGGQKYKLHVYYQDGVPFFCSRLSEQKDAEERIDHIELGAPDKEVIFDAARIWGSPTLNLIRQTYKMYLDRLQQAFNCLISLPQTTREDIEGLMDKFKEFKAELEICPKIKLLPPGVDFLYNITEKRQAMLEWRLRELMPQQPRSEAASKPQPKAKRKPPLSKSIDSQGSRRSETQEIEWVFGTQSQERSREISFEQRAAKIKAQFDAILAAYKKAHARFMDTQRDEDGLAYQEALIKFEKTAWETWILYFSQEDDLRVMGSYESYSQSYSEVYQHFIESNALCAQHLLDALLRADIPSIKRFEDYKTLLTDAELARIIQKDIDDGITLRLDCIESCLTPGMLNGFLCQNELLLLDAYQRAKMDPAKAAGRAKCFGKLLECGASSMCLYQGLPLAHTIFEKSVEDPFIFDQLTQYLLSKKQHESFLKGLAFSLRGYIADHGEELSAEQRELLEENASSYERNSNLPYSELARSWKFVRDFSGREDLKQDFLKLQEKLKGNSKFQYLQNRLHSLMSKMTKDKELKKQYQDYHVTLINSAIVAGQIEVEVEPVIKALEIHVKKLELKIKEKSLTDSLRTTKNKEKLRRELITVQNKLQGIEKQGTQFVGVKKEVSQMIESSAELIQSMRQPSEASAVPLGEDDKRVINAERKFMDFGHKANAVIKSFCKLSMDANKREEFMKFQKKLSKELKDFTEKEQQRLFEDAEGSEASVPQKLDEDLQDLVKEGLKEFQELVERAERAERAEDAGVSLLRLVSSSLDSSLRELQGEKCEEASSSDSSSSVPMREGAARLNEGPEVPLSPQVSLSVFSPSLQRLPDEEISSADSFSHSPPSSPLFPPFSRT